MKRGALGGKVLEEKALWQWQRCVERKGAGWQGAGTVGRKFEQHELELSLSLSLSACCGQQPGICGPTLACLFPCPRRISFLGISHSMQT